MAQHWITWSATRPETPLTYWVHTAPGRPFPASCPSRGFAVLHVHTRACTLRFASPAELDHLCAVLSRRHLPRPHRLSPVPDDGANGHWLSRLPARIKPWRTRRRLLQRLARVSRPWPARPE